jgi:hypothetical protein
MQADMIAGRLLTGIIQREELTVVIAVSSSDKSIILKTR